ncbi:hypothetical protein STVIR_5238 [Streptomyces viridochromogenes Tue57]|uniref:Uncharacterized protein n=1 Tax=Streptomyces viridochromogenes Tue57 TaxID=1160705 RepID=L8P888_STRVR|nr:hypothetical protein STVIR_5238 [Streptomyces viridochromogenes Tue57]
MLVGTRVDTERSRARWGAAGTGGYGPPSGGPATGHSFSVRT